ncbi:actin-like ATPase domain-containing protein [Gloeophyllum trabeum ATCC 11539]|uniref:Actin-like ATPase domain-containing protein n=1 Tax=Gloeophyllum trabeum (strain ATCC 11539 / FP-39264 / Madison 617) TaxID=670483 RepID=S7QP25_GLOTA|nr:actin-like ATPase domain-containing protein [Gloeophyllum trabeum ATCC 11539]EPQ61321.1 actin-like ATPase domain-containing protein [Gloeophyllum trabeum ATCC 11539]
MAANGTIPNGTAETAKTQPTVVGINFGNSYASIAEGLSECIANEDGERQIACAISFHGEELYIGNQAKHQLVKNAHNTIIGFRNILGKKFSEIPKDKAVVSAPVIQHPDIPDEPAYRVQVLNPAPTPLPRSTTGTPAASNLPTPRSEPTPGETVLTVSEVTSIFLRSLVKSAEDFLGKKVTGAVLSVPAWFDEAQRAALEKAASDADIHVLQLLEDAGAVAVTTAVGQDTDLPVDRTQLVVDVGQSSLELSLLSMRHGLAYSLGTITDFSANGDSIDEKLIKFFAKEFTKKTKTPLTVCPATDNQDKRAEAKLRLAIEHTKRTLSASPGAATCSVESLKDGLDFTGSINRLRFDMEVRPIYNQIYDKVKELVESAKLDLYDIDEVVYVGGSASFPGLDETLAQGLSESVVTPFTAGTVIGGGVGDPTTILARGCALQAQVLSSIGHSEEDEEVRKAFQNDSEWTKAKATSKSIGLIFPEENAGEGSLGGQWVPVILKETPLPCRRIVGLQVEVSEAAKVGFEVWEVKEGVKIEKVKPPKDEDDPEEEKQEGGNPDEDDEEEEEIETKEKTLEKESFLTSLLFDVEEIEKKDGRSTARIEVQFLLGADGKLDVTAWEVKKSGKQQKATATVSGPS